ncbi:hypothetical protein BST83_11460 [Polaribacter filamentus]|uniref:Secretion system C-terminal sorting domain-containing protein n=1 Tax=Polaribacter filamentus TaxID=53483 RepID=A0A2S7KYF2_9FLAO|nr:T9SS type A sorting domain-containing protein [Polaribacter filamentus]PQB07704.1 hypothetical protein BST83_11455 [Polaribacter filamentus]PQB07705.1 hypothetical protein BST83_11460 [Polaribacter filamentus]
MKIKLLFTCSALLCAFYSNAQCAPDEVALQVGTPCDDGNPATFYDIEDGNCGCAGISVTGTAEYKITDGNDDVEENLSDGTIGFSSSDLELGQDGSTAQMVGIRFNFIQIPKNATISSAYIQFAVKGTTSERDPTNVEIVGEKVGNSVPFAGAINNLSERPATTAKAFWDEVPVWQNNDDAGEDQKTPDLVEIVQEIVNLEDWAALNSMTFLISGEGSREAKSLERGGSDSKQPATLIINYDASGLLSTSDFNKAKIKIYPNPASQLVNIQSDKTIENISLYSILGHKVLSVKPNKSVTNLNISQLKSGVYFIHVKQNNSQVNTRKLVVE